MMTSRAGDLPTYSSKSQFYDKNPKKKKKTTAVGSKIKKILQEGVRINTRKPVSASNPRRPVSQQQAIAIALSMKRRGKLQ